MVTRLPDVLRAGSWKARLAVATGMVLALLTLLFLADAAVNWNRIHSGVSIAGYDVGRTTRADAVVQLTALSEDSQSKEIVLVHGDQEWPVLPTALGTTIDIEASVEEAFAVSREQNVFRDALTRLSLYFSPRDVALQGQVRTSSMDALIEEIAGKLDNPPVNAALQVEGGQVHITEGTNGRVVDRDRLRYELKALLFSLHATELPVPMMNVEPDIRGAETAEAVAEAETMISAPVTLAYGESSWTLEPERIASFLDFTVEGEGSQARLAPVVSSEKATEFLGAVAEAVDHPARKATWETNGETATIVPHQTGQAVDREKTAAALTAAAKSTGERAAKVAVNETPPDRTTEQAEEMGIEVAIGRFSTEFGGSENRRDNVQRAADLIDGTLIAPGEEFDFNSVVGPRTEDNGFKTAPVIIGGKLEDSLGGGICQVSTTLFNAVFFAGLDVTARTNHSLYISHYPTGRDATVSWGGPDFRFRNDTGSWILIRSASSPSSVLFVIYGTSTGREVSYSTSDWYDIQQPTEKRVNTNDLYRGETRVADGGQTGRKIKVTRTVTANGTVVHEDTFVSNYPMKPKVIEVGAKVRPTTTTAPPQPEPESPPATTAPTTSTTAG